MSGDWLALGAAAALVAASTRRRGSRAEPPLTLTYDGFPWPRGYPLYHATLGIRSIVKQGFRTRADGLTAAAGGGTDNTVSVTVSRDVAVSIVIGLLALRDGARGMKIKDLFRAFQKECPEAASKLEFTVEHNPSRWDLIDRGLIYEDAGIGKPLPQGAVAARSTGEPTEGWMGRDQRYYAGFWRKPRKDERKEVTQIRRRAFYEAYNWLSMQGSQTREADWAAFWGTDMDALAKVKSEDIGMLTVHAQVDRVLLTPRAAIAFEYLPRNVAVFHQEKLRSLADRIRNRLDLIDRYARGGTDYRGERYGARIMRRSISGRASPEPLKRTAYGFREGEQVGDFVFEPTGSATPSTTMLALDSMMEIRVYDPSILEVVAITPASRLLRELGLQGRYFAPYADDLRLPASRVAPGEVVRRER